MATALEVYANQATTTVSSGGTDAPSPGTQETWTVASSASFPTASSTASPPTQFHAADTAPAYISEIIAVTNVSGDTWTVTRGAENTTPVAHLAGFTIQQVGTAGGLGSLLASANNLSDVASRQTALNTLTGTQSAAKYLRSDGTNASLQSIQAADVPTLNQNTTGTASNITDTLDQVPAPAANVSMNSHKITNLENGSASSDAAAFGQLPSSGSPLPLSQGGTGVSESSDAALLSALGAAALAGAAFTGEVTVQAPVNPSDAVTKSYADAIAQGLSVKPSVQEATASALPSNTYSNGSSGVGATLTATADGALTVDGISVSAGDRVLVQNEATAAHNGIYTVTATGSASAVYVLTRATDMDTGTQVPGAFVFTEEGTVNAGAGFTVASPGPFTIGTTAINWTQFSGAGEITAGSGLTKTGNTLSVNNPLNQNTTGTASNITDTLDQVPAPAANVSMNSHKITNLENGSASSDAAAYGQTLAGGDGAPMTTEGDLLYMNATPAPARLAIGSAGNLLGVSSGVPAWTALDTSGSGGPTAAGLGLILQSMGVAQCTLSSGGVADQRALWMLVTATTSATVSKLGVVLDTAGTSADGSGINGLGLFTESGTLMSHTGDMTTAFESTGTAEASLQASQSVTAGTNYYLCVVTAFTGTQPGFLCGNPNANYPEINGHYLSVFESSYASWGNFTPSSGTANAHWIYIYGR